MAKTIISTSPKRKEKQAKRKRNKRTNGTCFVLMPFKEPFDTYFSVIIEPAVTAAHLKTLRGDSLFRPSPIMGDVWQMIQDAKILVAELTGKNANVFYELGLAHALGKPVVLVAETMEDVPFDLQPLRVILYNKSDPVWGNKLKGDLTASLEETLEDIAKAVPPMFRKIVKSQAPEDSDISLRLFELERRMAAVSSLQGTSPERVISRERTVDWERVFEYLRKPKDVRSTDFHPVSRAHAVAWAIFHLRSGSADAVRMTLQKNLAPAEAEAVFELALAAPRRLTSN